MMRGGAVRLRLVRDDIDQTVLRHVADLTVTSP